VCVLVRKKRCGWDLQAGKETVYFLQGDQVNCEAREYPLGEKVKPFTFFLMWKAWMLWEIITVSDYYIWRNIHPQQLHLYSEYLRV